MKLTSKLIKHLQNKKAIIFDLDGTLTESKSNLDHEMGNLLCSLLSNKKVVVMGGGKYAQFKKQFLNHLKCRPEQIKNLFLFPTNGAAFYKFKNKKWSLIYELRFKKSEARKIHRALKETFKKFNYKHPSVIYGKVIENRGAQITFSALGQEVVSRLGSKGLRLKKEWYKKNNNLRLKMRNFLQKILPQFNVQIGGLTSIDITPQKINKAYGIKRASKNLNIPIKDMVFVGDALFYGGNDYAAKETGILCLQIKDSKETKKLIEKILK